MKTFKYLKTINKKFKKIRKTKKVYKNIKYNFEEILGFKEIEEIIKKLNQSKFVKTFIVGKSIDKRNIYLLEIGTGNNIILFDAGIHAREIANSLFILKYMIDLINKLENDNEDLNDVKIVIVPLVNPDGYEAALYGPKVIKNKKLHIYKKRKLINIKNYKANSNGIDINRNFPSQHAGLHYYNYLSETVSFKPSLGNNDFYSGKVLGSEPETKALISIFNKYFKNIKVYISLHSSGREIYSGKPNLNNKYNLNSFKLANEISKVNKYQVHDKHEEEVGNGTDGTSTDYLSELASGFKFSTVTGRLSANSYKNSIIKNKSDISIATLETLENNNLNIKKIKSEYYHYKLNKVFEKIILLFK